VAKFGPKRTKPTAAKLGTDKLGLQIGLAIKPKRG
jgi:hypothetical protein